MTVKLEFEVPSWEEIYGMLLKLADRIRDSRFRPEIIVGVSRGGWPPARVLSDLLDIASLANVKTEFYLGVAETGGKPALTQPVSMDVSDRRVLIVDEISDTGRSLKLVRGHIVEEGASEVRIATLYHKPFSIVVPDYYERTTRKWVVFPWEIRETIGKIVKRCVKEGWSIEEETGKLVKAGLPKTLIKEFLEDIVEESSC